MGEVREITLEKLITNYSVLLLDAYGVLIDMSGPLPGAIDLIPKPTMDLGLQAEALQ